MATALLDDLAQRINKQESELQKLRQDLETRREQLAELTERRQELLGQLRKIDDEMTELAGGKMQSVAEPASAKVAIPSTTPTKVKPIPVVIPAKTPRKKAGKARLNGKLPLPQLLLTILGETQRPMRARELADEAKSRGFKTKSKDFPKNVESRLYDLQKRKKVRHPVGQPGFILTQGFKKSPATKAKQSTKALVKNGHSALNRVAPKQTSNPLPLREMLTNVLARSKKPLSAKELADRVLASGYKTTSKRFTEIIWVTLGRQKNIENIPGVGWRLKQSAR